MKASGSRVRRPERPFDAALLVETSAIEDDHPQRPEPVIAASHAWLKRPNKGQSWRVFWMMIPLLSLSVFFSGCDLKMPWDKPKPPTAAEEAATPEEPKADAEPVVVDERDFLPRDMKKLPFAEVSIPMQDGLQIYGRLYDPDIKEESDDTPADAKPEAPPAASADAKTEAPADTKPQKKYPLVILLHRLNGDHLSWGDLPAVLEKSGYAVYAMDLRGHGKSTHLSNGGRSTWRLFEDADWTLVYKDISTVIKFYQKDEDHPEIDATHVALIGEKLGANAAVMAAHDRQEVVKALVLISAGLNYKGIIPSQAILDYTNPVLLLTSQDDDYSNKSTHGLYNWITGPKTLMEYGQIGDGAEMFTSHPGIERVVRDWLMQAMPSGAPAPVDPMGAMQVIQEASKSTKTEAPAGHGQKPKPEELGLPATAKTAAFKKHGKGNVHSKAPVPMSHGNAKHSAHAGKRAHQRKAPTGAPVPGA